MNILRIMHVQFTAIRNELPCAEEAELLRPRIKMKRNNYNNPNDNNSGQK